MPLIARHSSAALTARASSLAFHSGELTGAQPLIASAVSGFTAAVGAAHPKTLHAMHSQGLLAQALGSHAEAASCFHAAHEGRVAALGQHAHDTLRSAIALGGALLELRCHAEAERLLCETEACCHRTLGAESPLSLHCGHQHALALAGLPGRRQQAIGRLRRVHGARVTVLGETHRDSLGAASDLGELLGKARATRAEARALLRGALAGEEATLGADAAQAARTRDRLLEVEALLRDGSADEDEDADAAGDSGGVTVAVLSGLFVEPSARRQGAARGALRLLIEAAWAHGASTLVALVPAGPAAHAASRLLRDAGFVLTRSRHPADGPPAPGSTRSLRPAQFRLERTGPEGQHVLDRSGM